jgi:hypothetical protein
MPPDFKDLARHLGFHRVCHELQTQAHAANIPREFKQVARFVMNHRDYGGMTMASANRYVRVVLCVVPEVLAQWPLKIPRSRLTELASMPVAQQLAQYRTMVGTRNVLRNAGNTTNEAGRAYAQQALALMRAGLSGEEIEQLIELLRKTDAATLTSIFKDL